MSLSDKIEIHNDFDSGMLIKVIRKKNVKKFIKKLKSELKYGLCRIKEPELSLTLHAIDKLAGKELSNGQRRTS